MVEKFLHLLLCFRSFHAVKSLDRGVSKSSKPSFWDILTEDQRVITVKEIVDLIEKGLMKIF